MEGHKKTDKENFYFVVIPKDPEKSYSPGHEFLISLPIPKEELEGVISRFQKIENCKKEDIKVEKVYMPLEEFRNKRPQGTYSYEKEKNSFLEENEKHKPKEVKSLSYYAAKTLAENPSFFNPEKATKEAIEQFEEAKKNIPNKK